MRAQTTLDFAIGVAVFLAVLLFAFTFVPGILDPFEVRGEEEPAISDRVGNTLATDMLGSPETPNVLDRHCTVAFFNDSVDDSDCSFDNDEGLQERLDLAIYTNINVTIVNSSSGNTPYCWTSTTLSVEPTLVERSSPDCNPGDDDVFSIGDEPTEGRTTITARRTVIVGGEIATLRVVVW